MDTHRQIKTSLSQSGIRGSRDETALDSYAGETNSRRLSQIQENRTWTKATTKEVFPVRNTISPNRILILRLRVTVNKLSR